LEGAKGSCSVEVISPIDAGGVDIVGVSQKSMLVRNFATPRAKAWQSSMASR
jgi:hypothetical protein